MADPSVTSGDELQRIHDLEEEVRRLKLLPGGFTPISAAIYDGYWTSDPQFKDIVRWKKEDVAFAIIDDRVRFHIDSGDPMPPESDPAFGGIWCPYVWYDDAFTATNGWFTVPEAGVYLLHCYSTFNVVSGVVDTAQLEVHFSPAGGGSTIQAGLAEQQALGTNDKTFYLNMAAVIYAGAGVTVKMGMYFDMSGVDALADADVLVEIPRSSKGVAPPTEAPFRSPHDTSRFSIAKIADTVPG